MNKSQRAERYISSLWFLTEFDPCANLTFTGGTDGSDGSGSSTNGTFGQGMGKSLDSNLMDNWVLSPGAGGLAYQGGNGNWFYGGGGGGVLVDGKVDASNPSDIITF